MKTSTRVSLAIVFIAVGTIMGCLLGQAYNKMHSDSGEHKPVLTVQDQPRLIGTDTQVTFEQEYSKCQHVIISAFPQREQLNGHSLQELQQTYSAANGYQVTWQGTNLLIHQKIDDWCPQDKGKLRLKEYQNRVAVYQGPDPQHDILLRVTKIPMDSLPQDVQNSIRGSTMEFTNQADLNDALENLDEYL